MPRTAAPGPNTAAQPGARRALQLALAAIWLLDGVLQLQPFMFSADFSATVMSPAASGNPAALADPINWAAGIVSAHSVGTNTAFACIQLALGAAIAWRPTARLGLAASLPWALGVWWFGEGFGGLLGGDANPISGAPGAVILYALLAVLLWPTDRRAPFPAAGFVGVRAARGAWVVLWGGLAYLTMQSSNTAPTSMQVLITSMAQGEPRWLASVQDRAATLVAGKGLAASIVLAVVLAVIALVPLLPHPSAARALLVLAIATALVIWVVGQAAGGLTLGTSTDPNTGPLLVLLALAYWPPRAGSRTPDGRDETGDAEEATGLEGAVSAVGAGSAVSAGSAVGVGSPSGSGSAGGNA